MDPATIVGLVCSAVTLATMCGSAAKDLHTRASKFKDAKLAILSMAQGLDTMQLAWSRIGKWAQNQTPDGLMEEDDFIGRLWRSLETGSLVMDALREELLSYEPLKMGLAQRTKVVWNEGILRNHHERIRDQAASMTLLLQAINLPTLRDRNDLLRGSEKQFKISDESAYSIVPSDMSTSIYTGRTTDSGLSKGEEDLVYKPLTFENELFTARVYKRNYASPAFRRLFKERKQKTSDQTRPPIVAQETAEDPDGSIAEILTIREPGHTRRWHNTAQVATLIPTEGQSPGDQDTSGEINMWPNGELSISFAEACKQGNVEMVDTLLKAGQDVHGPVVGLGWPHALDLSAIHVAAEGGHVQIVEILLSYGADKDLLSYVSRKRPLHLAVQAGHVAMVQYLLDNGTNVSAPDGVSAQAIHLAAVRGSAEILSLLVERGAAIDSAMTDGAQPLHLASENPGRVNVIKFICSQGADIEARTNAGYTPLHYACLRNAVDNMDTLLELGAAHSPQGPSIFKLSLENGCLQATRWLLERGMDPNLPISGQPSALHGLIKMDNSFISHCMPKAVETLELLLEYGADVNLQDSKGDTPLHCLGRYSGLSIKRQRQGIQLANLLLKSMRDVDTVNLAGRTALGVSVEEKFSEWLCKPLVDSGSRLLLRKPRLELGLNLHQSSDGDLSHLDCYIRQGYGTSTQRLGFYPEYFNGDPSSLRRWMEDSLLLHGSWYSYDELNYRAKGEAYF